MKDLKIKKKVGFLDFVTSKGFYLTLVVSLVLFGSTMWVVMNKSIDNVVDKNLNLLQRNVNSKTVNKVVQNLPIAKDATIHKDNSTQKNNSVDSDKPIAELSLEENSESVKDFENQDVLFVPPVVGEIVNGFSGGELVKNKTLSDWRVHNAVDIAAPQGTPVKSIADGEVLRIYNAPMLGMCVEIEHAQSTNSVYCGLNKNLNVKEGDIVEAGSVIGSVGNTAMGESELGPHLHLEIKEKGEKINPLSKIKLP